jgi:hypothetical protein
MTERSMDLTAFDFKADGPPAMHHREVTWSWLVSALAAFLALTLIFAGIALVVFKVDEWASQVRHQPSAATSISSVPQPSPYSRRAS